MKDWEKNIPDGEKANANTLIQKELGMFEEQKDQNVWNKEHHEHDKVTDVGMNQISQGIRGQYKEYGFCFKYLGSHCGSQTGEGVGGFCNYFRVFVNMSEGTEGRAINHQCRQYPLYTTLSFEELKVR